MKKNIVIIIMALIVALSTCFTIYLKSNKKEVKPKDTRFKIEEKYYGSDKFIDIDKEGFESIKKESYVLYIHNNYCNMPIPCYQIFESYMEKKNIAFLSMDFKDFKETKLHETVKYAPSVIIVKKGKIVSYLDSAKDGDLEKYQDVKAFGKWFEKYVKLK